MSRRNASSVFLSLLKAIKSSAKLMSLMHLLHYAVTWITRHYTTTRQASKHIICHVTKHQWLDGLLHVVLHATVTEWKYRYIAHFLAVFQLKVSIPPDMIATFTQIIFSRLAEVLVVIPCIGHLAPFALVA